MAEASTMRCANPSCNREHSSRVRYCPYCGSQQPEHAEVSKPIQAVPPAPDTTSPAGITQRVSPSRTDDERADDELWEKARSLDTIRVYEQYLHTNTPFKKRHIAEAEKRFEQLEKQEKEKDESLWKQACSEDTLNAYQEYLGKDLYAKRYTSEAQQKIKALEARRDDSKAEPVALKQSPKPSTDEVTHAPPPRGKWLRFALVGTVLIVAYGIWASLGGDTKTRGEPGQENVPNDDAASALQPELTSPTLNAPPPLTMGPSKQQQDESRCTALVEAGLGSLNQKPASDYERAIAMATEARSIMPDCPGAAGLLKQASIQRDFFIAERLRKEREDSLNLDRCQVMVTQGKQALQTRRYDQALRYAANAKNTYAQCPGVDLLEQEANTALATANQNADAEKQNQCIALVSAGNDAFLRRDYSGALRNAAKASRIYPGCPGAKELENNANEAICTQFVMNGREALMSGRYSKAVTLSRNAINTFARCPGAESLEQEALVAMNAAKDKADQENQERARVRCEALMDAGRDALDSKSYDQAINNAKRAKQAYSQCPGADSLEREATEAKRKARDSTAIF